MLYDIINSIIYLVAAQVLHLGGCLIADIKLRNKNDPELLEWASSYCKEHYSPYRGGKLQNILFYIKAGLIGGFALTPAKAVLVLPTTALLAWYITPADMEITRTLLLINLVYNAVLGVGALVTPKYKPLKTSY